MTIEDLYSEQSLAELARPGGYHSLMKPDPKTWRSRCLEAEDVPLDLANHILWAHSEATGGRATGWEASLANLADSLYVRCSGLEQRLAQACSMRPWPQ